MSPLYEKLVRYASWIMWLGRGVFYAVILLLVIMRSLVTVIRIDGHSMDPTLQDKQWILVDLISHRFKPWKRGDVVIVRFPGDPLHSLYVKRVIGLPGDTFALESGKVFINGVVLNEAYLGADATTDIGVIDLRQTIAHDQYIILGDNRKISNDSRFFGTVPREDMVGKVVGY